MQFPVKPGGSAAKEFADSAEGGPRSQEQLRRFRRRPLVQHDPDHRRLRRKLMPEADWEPSPLYASWPGCRKCRHFRGTHCAAYPVGILFEPISVEQPAKAAS